jgi:hypothetical protein
MAESSLSGGLAALAPNGLRGLPSIDYSQLPGKGRSQKPASGIERKVNEVANSIRPGTRTQLWSGQEPDPSRPVNAPDRHPYGYAGDFRFFDEKTNKQITDTGFFKDLSVQMAEEYNANIGYSETNYMGIGTIHIDTMPLGFVPGGPVWGQTARKWAKELAAARAKYAPKDEVFDTAAMTREAALSQQSQEAAVAEAYANPEKSFEGGAPRSNPYEMPGGLAPYTPPSMVAGMPAVPVGALPAARPTSMVASRPEYPGSMPAAPSLASVAPRGAVYAGIGAMDRALPSLASIASSYAGRTPSTPSAQPTKGPARENPPSMSRPAIAARPSAPIGRMPAAQTQAAPRAAVDTAINDFSGTSTGGGMLAASMDRNVAAAQQAAQAKAYADFETSRAKGMSSLPAPSIAPSTAKLAAQYAQYQPSLQVTPTAPPAVAPAVTPVAQPKPIETVITPPAYVPRPNPVEAPIFQAPAPPKATAYDVYSGQAQSALDNTGLNTVSAMPGGGTSVTNQYGVTTGMNPAGYQTAVGSMPSIPGISGPNLGKFGNNLGGALKGAIPGVAGSAIGGLLGGPIGALLGGALAKAATKPGGILSNTKNFNTAAFGTITAARPQYGGKYSQFPDAPSLPSAADAAAAAARSRAHFGSGGDRPGYSPAASRDAARGLGGLY